MDEGLGLRGEQALLKNLGLALDALGEWQRHGALDRINCFQGGHLPSSDLAHLGPCGVTDRRRLFRRAQALVALACLGVRAAARTDLGGKLDRTGQQCLVAAAFDYPIDDAVSVSVRGRDRIADRAHLHGLLHPCQARQTLRAVGARDDSQLDFRLTDLGGSQRHSVLAALGRLQAAAKSGAMDCRHGRLGGVLEALDYGGQAGPAPLLAGSDLAELLDVRPGYEGSSATDQHDGLNAGVIAELLNTIQNALRDAGTERVYRGVFDRDYADAALDAQADQVRHAYLLGLGAGTVRARQVL